MTGAGREEHPTACSTQVVLELDNQIRAAEIQKSLESFLTDLMHFLQENGCKLIGHIKGLLDAGERGQLFFSITSFNENPRYKGEIGGEIPVATLSINAIVYGIGERTVEQAIQECLGRRFAKHLKQ
jgi:hypothetical protein